MEILKDFLMLNLLPFLAAFGVTAMVGPAFIKWLRKLKFGQEIRDEGPKWHEKKSGTPTMGGIMFIVGIVVALIAVCIVTASAVQEMNHFLQYISRGLKIILVALGFGAIGFVDDYIKVVKKRNLGLTSKQKFLLQLLMAVIYIIITNLWDGISTGIDIPFTNIVIDLPLWIYVPFIIFVIVGVVNAVNLTDGLDGLASSITVVTALTFGVAAFGLSHTHQFVSNVAMAVVGGLLGFLIYNKYPAKVFMGDTGSLFLGAMVVLLAIDLNKVLYLVLIGFVYFAETLSVIIQTSYFKYTKKKYGEGRRIFKMSPLHHHFEMCGWKEVKIVRVFTLVTVVLCLISLAGMFMN